MAIENERELCVIMGRWDTVRADWLLNPEEEAHLLGGTGMSGPVDQAESWEAPRMEQRMRLFIELWIALDMLMADEERVRRWLRRPLSSLGDRSPIQAMASSVEWIRTFKNIALDFAA